MFFLPTAPQLQPRRVLSRVVQLGFISVILCFTVEPVNKVSKKAKPQKAAFASIFKKANQREMSQASPGRKKVSEAAKVTAKTGNFTCIMYIHIPGL